MSSKGVFVEAGADGKNPHAPSLRQQPSDSDALVAVVTSDALFAGDNTNRPRNMYCSNHSCYSYSARCSAAEIKGNALHMRTLASSLLTVQPSTSSSSASIKPHVAPVNSGFSATCVTCSRPFATTTSLATVYPSPELSDVDDVPLDNSGYDIRTEQQGRKDLRRRPSLDMAALASSGVEQRHAKRLRQSPPSPRSVRMDLQIPTPIFSRPYQSTCSLSPNSVCPPAPRHAHTVLSGSTLSSATLGHARHTDDVSDTTSSHSSPASSSPASSSPASSSPATVLSAASPFPAISDTFEHVDTIAARPHTPLHLSLLNSPPYRPADLFPDNNEEWHEQVVEFDWASSTDEDERNNDLSDNACWSGIDCMDETLSELETRFGLDNMNSPPYQPTDYNELNPAMDPQEARWFEQPKLTALPPLRRRDSSPPYVPFDYNTLNPEIEPNEDRYFEQPRVKYVSVDEDSGFDSSCDGDISSNDASFSEDGMSPFDADF
ncbi:hypothetical protein EC991_002958 [Linnemannia zychae]|nr:hypothetical protein EC991_002958 [Linnemannia zychae]